MGKSVDFIKCVFVGVARRRWASVANLYLSAMELSAPTSVIGRLVDELSWEGRRIRRLRNGGRGDENVLTAEVLLLLSYLPRSAFLGAILRAAHGAQDMRLSVASKLEDAAIQMFPDQLTLPGAGIGVQPDAAIWHDDFAVILEAKGPRTRAQFQKHQLAREFLALMADPRRDHMLMVIIDSPPPVKIQSAGRMELIDGVRLGLEDLCLASGRTAEEFRYLSNLIPETVCWVTWQEIRSAVAQAAVEYPCEDANLKGTLQRLARGVTDAIDWHSRSTVLKPPTGVAASLPRLSE